MPDLTEHQRRIIAAIMCQTLAHDLPCEGCGVAVAAVEPVLASLLDHAEEAGYIRGFGAGARSARSVPEAVGEL